MEDLIAEVTGVSVEEKNADTVRKLNNFIKNLRRDSRNFDKVKKDPNSSQYQKRRALAERIATDKVIKRLENLVA